MNRILSFCLAVATIFTLTGCKNVDQTPTTRPSQWENSDPIVDDSHAIPLKFSVQYIRTDGYQSGAKYPKVELIKNKENLDAYYTTYREIYNLERRETVYSDTSVGFLDACDKYDAAFFEENYLIFVLLEEGSGSVRHGVEQVTQIDSKSIRVDILREIPEVGTSDMAEWHLILELSRDVLVDSPNDVQVYLDSVLAFNGRPVETPYTESESIYKSPPNGCIITPEGEYKLTKGSCNWTHRQENGEYISIVADQAGRPIEQRFMDTVTIDGKYLETVYAPVPGKNVYEPTNSLGCLLKLDFEVQPNAITFTCWPDTVWQDSNTPEETVISHEGTSFYAKPGGYVYEIVAKWDHGSYYGTAIYYVSIDVGVGS